MRVGRQGDVGGIAHFADIGAQQGAGQRGLAVVGVRNQRQLDLDRRVVHFAGDKASSAPPSSGWASGWSRLTKVAGAL